MLENKFVRTLLCFFLWFTRCSTHGLVHGSTHGKVHGSTYSFFTWSYAWFLLLVLLIVYVHGSTIVSSYGFFSLFNSCSLFVVLQWFCSCSWFNSRSLLWFLPLVSSYGSVHGSIYVLCSWFFS